MFQWTHRVVPIRVRSMNAEFYPENIISEHVMPFVSFLGSKSLLIQDTAHHHVARQDIDYMNSADIPLMK